MNTTENNILIAEFLGVKPNQHNEYEMYGVIESIDQDDQHFYAGRNLHFDCDWNWLMTAVEKIESLNYWVNRINGDVWIVNDRGDIIINNTFHQGGIEATYNAVVEFIKWHNQQK